MDEEIIKEIEKKLDYHFQDRELLIQAFTHRSFANTQAGAPHNERLEFLGDSVLGFVVAQDLYRRFPDETEGTLSKIKAYMVHSNVLAAITEKLALHRFLLVEQGEQEIRHNRKLKENLLEAVIGAVYLDSGLFAAETLIINLFDQTNYRVTDPSQAVFDYKTRLQEAFQGLGLLPPDYVLLERRGPVHDAIFVVELRFNGISLATGEGQSKKQAHQDCAARVLEQTDNGKDLARFLHEADSDFSS
ncbi:MAG: ribonuclease III [Acidobacteria bacterium]|nr:ribonuclease III [Acidobacteriota bacterium]